MEGLKHLIHSVTMSSMSFRSVSVTALLICLSILVTGCAPLTGPKVEQPVDDYTITKSIKAKISGDPELSRLRISVTAKQGEVTLSGQAPNREIKNRIIKLALGVQGVRSVKDSITIKKK
jgi:hyperosmotically inducible protein